MANILLLDDSDVAGRAMQGILARGNHGCFFATEPEQAWKMMREGVVFDLLFAEVKLSEYGGSAFLQRIRNDWYWKNLPIVPYTTETEPAIVKRMMGLNVQNYLIKPYNPELIYVEVEKAMQRPWRSLHFEVAKTFCAQKGLSADSLAQMRRDLMAAFDKAAQTFPDWAEERQNQEVFEQVNALIAAAEEAGVRAGIDFLRDLLQQAAAANWFAFRTCAENLEFASRLIFCHLNPSHVPGGMGRESPQQVKAREAAERSRWEGIDVAVSGPVLTPEALKKQVDGLAGCPVVDTVAAAFQMTADGRVATMSQMMDLVASDPGLSAQILSAVNSIEHDELNEVEDPQAAAGRLGQLKLNALVRTLPTAHERHLDIPPFTWPNFWMFQVAVGRVAQFICTYLDFDYLASNAYTAGLLQDIGKLFLLKLHPFGLQAIVKHARERKVPIADAERKYLGCTTRDLAVHFAETQGLPSVYTNVIRWVETPALATKNMELVAIVSVARHVCLHSQIGCSAELPIGGSVAIGATPAWCILQPHLFPSFELKKFELQAHAFCLMLKNELSGKRDRRPSHAQRAAELV